ncbi:MAG TPA: helix-turn-helix transcriptional regulator [Streptosporangiaceae bacterium]
MTSAQNPTARRRELGVLLRALRTERDWTVEYVAQQLLCSPSKVSRMETGHRGASARDIRDLCELYGIDDEQGERMMALASEGRQRGWWQSLNLPYSTYIGLEAEAASISDYGVHVIPGLLQTADYAQAVLRTVAPDMAPEAVGQRVKGRITRQRILTSEDPPRFDAVVDESVLHRVVGSPAIMLAQMEKVQQVSRLPNVSFRVIPFDAGLPPTLNAKFIVLRFERSAIPDVVYIELDSGDRYLDEPGDIWTYISVFSALLDIAATPEETRVIVDQKIADYRQRTRYPSAG